MSNNLGNYTKSRQNQNIYLGVPKNQKRCWYKIGSPPPAGSKKQVLKFRSVSNIVIAPARTGSERSKRKPVKKTDQVNRGMISRDRPEPRILEIVVMKLIDPRMEDTPAKWRDRIPKSTEDLGCPRVERGGYKVQPVPIPDSRRVESSMRVREGGRSQKDKLFSRGKAMSGEPIIRGTSQLPNPPIIVGITKKKIIIKA